MIRTIEEYSLNALPALQTMIYDGWVLRFAGGYSKRANSVNPLYPSTEPPLAKIRNCEQFYAAKNLSAVFKITPAALPPALDAILAEQGYRRNSPASVQVLDLTGLTPSFDEQMIASQQLTEEWLTDFCRFSSVSNKNKPVLKYMLKNIIPNKYIVSLKAGSSAIGGGVGVLQGEFIGLYDIVIDSAYRNQGYGQKLVSGLLRLGRSAGAKKAYLQVMVNNYPAVKLYSGMGFTELYQYWYRIK